MECSARLSPISRLVQARKAAALAQNCAPSNPEIDAQVDREIKLEATSIKRTCDELAVQIHEVGDLCSSSL